MRQKRLKGSIFAIRLTPGNLELVEQTCRGSIKGTKLPRDQRCIDFYANGVEYRIDPGDWYVEIRNGPHTFKFVWMNKDAKVLLEDIDDVTY